MLIGCGAGLCSLAVELVCAHWWWSWSVLIGDGADLTGGGAGLRSLVVEQVCAH